MYFRVIISLLLIFFTFQSCGETQRDIEATVGSSQVNLKGLKLTIYIYILNILEKKAKQKKHKTSIANRVRNAHLLNFIEHFSRHKAT